MHTISSSQAKPILQALFAKFLAEPEKAVRRYQLATPIALGPLSWARANLPYLHTAQRKSDKSMEEIFSQVTLVEKYVPEALVEQLQALSKITSGSIYAIATWSYRSTLGGKMIVLTPSDIPDLLSNITGDAYFFPPDISWLVYLSHDGWIAVGK